MVSVGFRNLALIVINVAYIYGLAGMPLVDGKNIADIIPYRDQDGKLRRMVDQEETLRKRDAQGFQVDLDDILSTGSSLAKRDPKRLPLDIEELLENEEALAKRGQKTFANDVLTLSLDSKLPNLNEVSIFYEYVRNDIIISKKLSDENEDLIIISPSNEAISGLSLKPWQFPEDIESLESAGATDVDIDSAIEQNVLEFVRSHVVEYEENKSVKNTEMGYTVLKSVAMDKTSSKGGDILLKKEDEQFYVASIRDGIFHPVKKVETAANGVVLVIDSCLVWP